MSASVKLYELAEARDLLDGWLAESEGEVTPELAQLLDELQGKTEEKIERVALYVREQLATAEAIESEAKRLQARAATQLRAAEGLKAYLKTQMERLDVRKVQGLLCTVAIQNSAPAVKTPLTAEQLYALDDARPFVKRAELVTYTLDRSAVLAAHKAGQALPPGLAVEQSSHVRIR